MISVEAKASDPGLIRWAGPCVIGRGSLRSDRTPQLLSDEMWRRIGEAMRKRAGGVAVIIRRAA